MDAPLPPPPLASTQDEEHLRLLTIFHYVVAGLTAVFACFPLFHVVFGAMMVTGAGIARADGPPALFGLMFMGLGLLFVTLGWTLAVCTFLSGRYLARRRNRVFTLVVAGIHCMFPPIGTLLGIFTIIVLSKESVRRLYPTP